MSLGWKSERVMDDESGGDDRNEVTNEWGGESNWRGWRNESGSWFQRRVDAYLNERSVIFNEENVGGREAVWCTKAVEWIARQVLETWKHRQFAEQKPFWLVFLIEHKVLHCYTRQTRSTAAWLRDNCIVLWLLFSKLSMLPSFQPLSGYCRDSY